VERAFVLPICHAATVLITAMQAAGYQGNTLGDVSL